MTDVRLSDAEWGTIWEFLRQESRAKVGRDADSWRRFLDAVKWMSRAPRIPLIMDAVEHPLAAGGVSIDGQYFDVGVPPKTQP